MQSAKETAANMAASAKAGMDKTKATVQEKVEKMSAHDPMQKERATEKKEMKKAEAEMNKQEAREQNAASKQAAKAGGQPHYTTGGDTCTHSATGTPGYLTGTQQMSAMPGHGSGQPHGGHLDSSGLATTHPTGLPGDITGHSTHVEGTEPGYGAGAGAGAGTGPTTRTTHI